MMEWSWAKDVGLVILWIAAFVGIELMERIQPRNYLYKVWVATVVIVISLLVIRLPA